LILFETLILVRAGMFGPKLTEIGPVSAIEPLEASERTSLTTDNRMGTDGKANDGRRHRTSDPGTGSANRGISWRRNEAETVQKSMADRSGNQVEQMAQGWQTTRDHWRPLKTTKDHQRPPKLDFSIVPSAQDGGKEVPPPLPGRACFNGVVPGVALDHSLTPANSRQPFGLRGRRIFAKLPMLSKHCRVGGGIGIPLTPLGGPATPTRGFTAAVSVFRGTPPQKPVHFSMSDFRCLNPFRLIQGPIDAPINSTSYLSHMFGFEASTFCIFYF
jgi:hypothetical protein